MRALIDHDAARVIGEVPPIEEKRLALGCPFGRTDPLIPVDRSFELSFPQRQAVVQPVRADHPYRSQLARTPQVPRLVIQRIAASLHAYLDDSVGSMDNLDHLDAFFGRAAQGLFDIDVLAGSDRIEQHPVMPVLGRGDDHGVDVLVVEQLSIVTIGLRSRTGFRQPCFEIRFVDVANRADLDVLVPPKTPRQRAAPGLRFRSGRRESARKAPPPTQRRCSPSGKFVASFRFPPRFLFSVPEHIITAPAKRQACVR